MGYLVGALYFYLWCTSIFAGYICLYCPILPILLISNKWYRYCTDTILTFWQLFPTALIQFLCKTEIIVTGDPVIANEMAILIMNHRTRTDWNFLWPCLYHCTRGRNKYRHSTKFLLKDVIRHVPGPGWVMQLNFWIFIKRSWASDKKTLETLCNYLEELSYKFSIILFPEGTDFTAETKWKSDCYARKQHLQEYEYLLHPRTTGFSYLTHQLRQRNCLDAVYDLTIIYPDVIPQTEKELFRGKFPKQVKIHIVRHSSSTLPTSEEDLKKYLENIWDQKEAFLEEFNINGTSPSEEYLKTDNIKLIPVLCFWTILPYVAVHLLLNYDWFRQLFYMHTIFLILISFLTPGFQWFEIGLYNVKKLLLGPRFAF